MVTLFWFSLAVAALLLAIALLFLAEEHIRARHFLPTGLDTEEGPSARAAAASNPPWPHRHILIVCLFFATLAGAMATLNDKVPDANDRAEARDPSSEDRASGTEGSWPVQHLSSFAGPAKMHDRSPKRSMCLVRYFDRRRGQDPGATWWTTCRQNAELVRVSDVRSRLALPHAWGRRDARVIAHVPPGEQVLYLSGKAAPQCEADGSRCYPGGGSQMLFQDEDFQRSWFTRYECSRASSDGTTTDFRPCLP